MKTETVNRVGADALLRPGQALSILRYSDVTKKTGLSRSAIQQRLGNRDFPEPIKLGARAVGFIEHEVNGWLEQLVRVSRSGTCRAPSAVGEKS